MDEVSLAESLGSLNRSAEPDPGFREDLFAALQAEYDVAGGSVATFPVHAPDEEATLQAQPRPQERGWSWQWAAVAFVVVGVLGLLTYMSLPGSDDLVNPPQGSTAPEPGTTAAVPSGRAILGADQIRLPEGMHPLEMTADDSHIAFLVSSELQPVDEPPLEQSELIVVDRSTGDIVVRTSLGGAPNRLALDESGIWVTHFDTGAVTLVDRSTGEITLEIALELPFDFGGNRDGRLFLPNDIVVGDETVWVSTARGAVASIDKSSGEVQYVTDFRSEVPGAEIQGPASVSDLTYLNGDLWIGLNLGGVTLLDPATGAMTNVGLAVLDHGAERIEEVDGRVYAVGNRLLRTGDEELDLTGSYTLSEESALSVLDAETGQPEASAVIDGTIILVGDVGGEFGALSDSGLFHRLDPLLASQEDPWTTSFESTSRLVSLDGEAWLMDPAASRLLRVQPTGPPNPPPAPSEPTVTSIAIDQDVSLRVLAVRPNNPSLAVLDLTERTTTVYPPGAHALPRDATDGAVATPGRDWIIWTSGVARLFSGALGEVSAELGPNPPREISSYAPALRVVPAPDSDRAWLVQPGLTAGGDDYPTLVDLVRVSDGSTLLSTEAEGSAFPVAATGTGLVLNVHDWFDTGDGFVTEPGTELVVHMLEDGSTVPLGDGRAIAASPTRVIRIVSNRLLISGPDGSGEVEVVMPFNGTWMEVGGPMIPSDAMPFQTVSPDGSEVLVRLGRELDANSTPADSELLAVNLSDGTTRRIAESNEATPVATWSSDGEWIALFWRNDITLINSADTGTQIFLENVVPEDHFPLAAG